MSSSASAKRTTINTIAQYIRAVVNIILSLYATRFVLAALGQDDYGIYSVVAYAVSMLGFVTNALLVTTQRYISYYHGTGNTEYVKLVFKNSVFLHVVFGIVLILILYVLKEKMIIDWLVIDPSREQAAMYVYGMVLIMLLLSILSAPFKAAFIARENIVYISIVEICDGILKFVIATSLQHATVDKLQLYAGLMVLIQLLNFFAYSIFSVAKYSECQIKIDRKDISKQCLGKLCNFAGWSLYSMGCIVGRNQGLHIVFNNFFGTILNSAYGIAMQVSGSIQFFSQAILNAMNPQIMKAEGAACREKMLELSEQASKYALLLLSMFAIPLVIEMPAILEFWLKDNVPNNTLLFCRMILIASMCDQLTIGLGSANQAIGRIRNYSLVINTIKVTTIPITCILLSLDYSLEVVMCFYVAIELICAMARLPFLKYTAGLSITHFVKNVFLPVLFPIVALVLIGLASVNYLDISYRFIYTIVVSIIIDIIVIWYFTFGKTEREFVTQMVRNKINKK